jgi:hypothetical protein
MHQNLSKKPAGRHHPFNKGLMIILLLAVLSLSCNLSSLTNQINPQDSGSQEDANQIAASVQQTLDARKQLQQPSEMPSATIPPAAPPTAEVAAPTEPPPPPTEEPPTETPTAEVVDIESQIQNANILLYEDSGSEGLKRYVKEALDRGGYQYTDVAGEIGRFKTELLSGVEWDLIISAAEARSHVRGEFFDYMNDALNNDAAVIIEVWYLDEIIRGKVSSIMDRCGFRLYKDWYNPDKDSRSIFWLDPSNPLFSEPNPEVSLVHYGPYWMDGDVGDLLMSTSSSNGVLVAGTIQSRKNDHGTIGVCDDGRLILQTFSSHDYKSADVINLWQNYIYYTLKNHFNTINNR